MKKEVKLMGGIETLTILSVTFFHIPFTHGKEKIYVDETYKA